MVGRVTTHVCQIIDQVGRIELQVAMIDREVVRQGQQGVRVTGGGGVKDTDTSQHLKLT